MAFSRAAAFRGSFRAARLTPRPQLFRSIARRGYASGGHESAKAGGDAIWAAGATIITVPTCWYLLSNGPDTSHAHSDHGEAHGKEHGEGGVDEGEEESKDDGKQEKSGEMSDGGGEDPGDDTDSDESGNEDEANKADTPDTSGDEGEKKDGNTKKSVPDAKGGFKKRTESDRGIKQGEDVKEGGGARGVEDKAASSKPAGSKNTQSGKQEGLTNTDTKHPSDPTNSSVQSKKGEGTPETSKAKGTVDSSRPQA